MSAPSTLSVVSIHLKRSSCAVSSPLDAPGPNTHRCLPQQGCPEHRRHPARETAWLAPKAYLPRRFGRPISSVRLQFSTSCSSSLLGRKSGWVQRQEVSQGSLESVRLPAQFLRLLWPWRTKKSDRPRLIPASAGVKSGQTASMKVRSVRIKVHGFTSISACRRVQRPRGLLPT